MWLLGQLVSGALFLITLVVCGIIVIAVVGLLGAFVIEFWGWLLAVILMVGFYMLVTNQ